MLDSAGLIDLETRLGAANYQPLDVVLTEGKGAWVTDIEGNRYLDCLAAYSAVNQGHCHPKILAAMVEQAGRLTLTSRAFRNDQLGLFYEELAALTNSHKVLPMNSGAEAVETAIKAVRKWGYEVKGVPEGEAEIIVCADNFHGRTLAVVSFSTDPDARGGYGPFVPGFKVVPFGDAEALEAAITPNTVGFLVEPIQGEAGVIIPPAGYFTRVREICSAAGVTLILDEIQTGLGRTGKLLAEEHEGIEADVTLIGKALGGGFYPVSAVLSNSDVLGVLEAGPARLDLRRQPAGLRRRPGVAEGAGRGGDDRAVGRARRLLQGRPRGGPLEPGARGARPRPDAGGRAPRRRRAGAAGGRGAARAGHPRQGHPRPDHPLLAAAGDRARRGGLGAGADRRGAALIRKRRIAGKAADFRPLRSPGRRIDPICGIIVEVLTDPTNRRKEEACSNVKGRLAS